jgi:7-carboxy-7-deazaguanine synthase
MAGCPAVFLRLSGCNLRCSWCDTKKSWEPGSERNIGVLLERLLSCPERLVVVTGGEPLLQPEVLPLCRDLIDAGKCVLVETNGSLDISKVPKGVRVILDVKCPASGMSEHNDFDNLKRLRPGDEVKFVLADRGDFDWAVETLGRKKMPDVPVLFSPAYGFLTPAECAKWILGNGLNVRMQVQLHRIVWDKEVGEGEPILDVPVDSK